MIPLHSFRRQLHNKINGCCCRWKLHGYGYISAMASLFLLEITLCRCHWCLCSSPFLALLVEVHCCRFLNCSPFSVWRDSHVHMSIQQAYSVNIKRTRACVPNISVKFNILHFVTVLCCFADGFFELHFPQGFLLG